MDSIFERAARCGVETEYRDGFGNLRAVDPKVLARILDALATGGAADRMLPRTILVRGSADQSLRLAGIEGQPLRWQIIADGKIAEGGGTSPLLTLPAMQNGVFLLRVTISCPGGHRSEDVCLIICHGRAYQGGQTAPARMWALAVQLYGVRSLRNWGHGDFTDLAALVDLAAELAAAGIGLTPLHARFDDRAADASPYAPNSRLFLNPLYIDVEAVPEFPGLKAAGLQEEIDRLRGQNSVDYEGVANAKTGALKLAYEAFLRQGTKERQHAFARFRDGADRRLPALHVLNGCGGISATPGGNGRPRGEEQKTKASLRSVTPRQKRSGSLSSCNGWPTINSTAVVRKPRNGSCRSGSISISPSAFARTASMPGAIRMRCCREWPWERRRTRSTLRDRTGGWLASILRVSKSGNSSRFAAC